MNTQITSNGAKGPPMEAMPGQPLRLKLIRRADFRKSANTMIEEALKEAENLKLGPSDCVLMISGTGKVLRFVFGFLQHEQVSRAGKALGRAVRVLPSRDYRICDGGTWNPYMLKDYAAEIGLDLQHLKKFEAHLRSELRGDS